MYSNKILFTNLQNHSIQLELYFLNPNKSMLLFIKLYFYLLLSGPKNLKLFKGSFKH
jgi:hypothetical protein